MLSPLWPWVGLLLVSCASIRGAQPPRTTWGFTAPWRPQSYASATVHASDLDAVVSGWIQLDSASGRPLTALFPDTLRRAAHGAGYMALVTSYLGDRFHPETIRLLARDPGGLGRVAGSIAEIASRAAYRGLIVDFEGQTRDDIGDLVAVTRAIADSARRRGVASIAMAIPAADTGGYPAKRLIAVVDLLVVMLYDQHWSTSAPGPIASPAWAGQALALRVAEVGPDRLVAGLPLYGYQWVTGAASATVIGYRDAIKLAADAGTSLARDERSHTLHAAKPGEWELWVADAGLLADLERETESLGVRRQALWALGWEDAAVWPLVRRR
ncbi:MAG: hypothetical protein NVS9B3_06540 [Gemmatimonadaceae bacterium]